MLPLLRHPWVSKAVGCQDDPMNAPWQSPEASRASVAPRLAALAGIAAQVAAATTLEELTETVTERASTAMGASRAVLAVQDGAARLRTIATHGLSPVEARQWAVLELGARSPLTDAVRTTQVVSVSGRAQLLERYPELDDGEERSSVTLPLISRADGAAIGAVGFRFDGLSRQVDPDLVWVLGVLADMCAQTMLRLRAEAQSASRAAQLEFLADASQALAASLDYRQTLRQVASLAVPTHADWCSVQMVDDGVLRTLAVAHVDPDKVQLAKELETRWPSDPQRSGGAAQVARTGKSLLIETITDEMLVAAARDEEHLRVARELGLRSAMTVPLVANGRVLGVLTFVAAESGRRYTRDDVSFAEDLARRAGSAIDNADLYSQTRRVASVLQATLLPQDLPEIAGWQIGTVYRQAGRTDVGGDYYDVSGLDGGRVTVVLGDVMGRGVDAAVAGSRMRSAARVLATQDPEPDALAGAMDRFMATEPPRRALPSTASARCRGLLRACRSWRVTSSCSTPTVSSSVAARASTSGSGGCRRQPTSCSSTSTTVPTSTTSSPISPTRSPTPTATTTSPCSRFAASCETGVGPSHRLEMPAGQSGAGARTRRTASALCWCADESARRSRQGLGPAEERPGSTGQGGGQQPPGVTRGTVPQRTDRRPLRQPVRVKRWCKRPPALQVTGAAR
jgi:GAF domain-containing protein